MSRGGRLPRLNLSTTPPRLMEDMTFRSRADRCNISLTLTPEFASALQGADASLLTECRYTTAMRISSEYKKYHRRFMTRRCRSGSSAKRKSFLSCNRLAQSLGCGMWLRMKTIGLKVVRERCGDTWSILIHRKASYERASSRSTPMLLASLRGRCFGMSAWC
jgi:hypothetical protein